MDRRQLWRHIRRVWITVGLSVTVIFVTWSLVAYRASAAARDATRSDATVAVRHDDGRWSFRPPDQREPTTPALVFFPGALVDPVAYAPLLRAVAGAGFPAYMIDLPRRGAFGGADDPERVRRLDRLLGLPSTPKRWVVAGHSRGAVVASQVAGERRAGLTAPILIGTSHPRDVNLNRLTVSVTKIVGTRDGLASPAEVEANRALLPAATRWVWIEGGNHSQFGGYGFQPGDRRATIAAPIQRATMIRAVLEVMTHAATIPPDGD
jgi:pimeloyl-ACP methyl ester carboxylesterase